MTATMQLKPVPLSQAAFSPFGEVIQSEGAQHFPMNGGTLERYYDLASIDVGVDTGGRPVMSIARCRQPTALPLDIHFLERHPHGSQAIYPLFAQSMLVVVAPPGDQISAEQIRAFYSDGQQGINFAPGVWHLPILALQADQAFMIVDRGGPNQNCDEFHFETDSRIQLLAPDE